MTEKKKKINKFFVYGTLKEGRPLDRKTFAKLRTMVQEATITGDIYSLGSYPTIKLDGTGMVVGEVHTFLEKDVDDVKHVMDQIEGYNGNPKQSLFTRHKVKATLKDGKVVTAWAYQYTGKVSDDRKLKDGVWEPGM